MNCDKAQTLMPDHLYGELKPRKKRALLRHLRECTKCSEEFKTHKATASTFAKLGMETPPAGLSAKIAALATEDIRRHEADRATIGWNWKPAMAVVATAMLAVVVVIKYIPQAEIRQSAMDAPVAPSARTLAKQPALESRDERKELASGPSLAVQGEVSSEYYSMAEEIPASGRYGGERDKVGDDLALNGVFRSPPRVRARGLAGGKMLAEEPADSISALHAAAPAAKQEPERFARKASQSTFRYDAKDQSALANADTEIAAGFAQNRLMIAEPEAPAPVERQAPASEPEAMKKEKDAAIGGTISLSLGARMADFEDAQEKTDNGYFNGRELNEVVMSYEKIISRKLEEREERDTPEAMLDRGRAYQKANDCEKAIPVYEAIPEEDPDFAEMADVYVALGECYLEMGRIEDALRSFEIVRDKFPAKRELALERIDRVRSSQKATEKANEPSPEPKDSAESE